MRRIGLVLLQISMTLLAERTKLKSGFHQFSTSDDVEMGLAAAKDAETQLGLVNNRDANAWVAALGQKLVSQVSNQYKFPFTFKIVDDRAIIDSVRFR